MSIYKLQHLFYIILCDIHTIHLVSCFSQYTVCILSHSWFIFLRFPYFIQNSANLAYDLGFLFEQEEMRDKQTIYEKVSLRYWYSWKNE